MAALPVYEAGIRGERSGFQCLVEALFPLSLDRGVPGLSDSDLSLLTWP